MNDRMGDFLSPDAPEIGKEAASDQGAIQSLFAALADPLNEGIVWVNRSGEILFHNPAAAALFDAAQTLTGLSLHQLFPSGPLQDFTHQLCQLQAGQILDWMFEITPTAGVLRQISVSANCWACAASPYSYILRLREFTQPGALPSEGHRTNDHRFRTIIEDQTNLIYRFWPNGIISYANEVYCRYWMKDASEIVGTSLMTVIPREDRPRIRAQFISLTVGCPAVTYETRVIMPDGTLRWQQRTDQAIFNEQGQPTEFVSVGHDITERMNAESALKDQLALGQLIVNISTRFISVVPPEIDKEMIRALQLLGEFLELDVCTIQIIDPQNKTIEQSYEWISPQSLATFQAVQQESIGQYAWSLGILEQSEILQISHLDDLPPEAEFEKKIWTQMGIQSVLGLPLTQGNEMIGIFGLASEKREKDWTEMETGLLKVLAEIFISVWIRRLSLRTLQETQQQLNQRIQELENRAREIHLLTEMSNRLQIANRFEETYLIVADYARQLYPNSNGALWMLDRATNTLQLKNQWGLPVVYDPLLITEDCWALRRTRQYFIADDLSPALLCRHLGANLPSSSLCIPIMAQGITVGLLHLATTHAQAPFNTAAQQLLAVTAEQMGLALSNLQLREDLREQAIRDPLTGLYNRYFMEISLEREVNRAARSLKPVTLMLLDIDHFREINAKYDHAAGDGLLAELSKILRNSIRSEDIACRFSGEKFMLILPDTSLEVAQQRALQLREEAKQINIWYEGELLPAITFTIVLADWPQHAATPYELIRLAETNLKQAKQSGYDQISLPDGNLLD